MKRLILNTISLFAVTLIFGGCDKIGNFPGAEVNPNIAIYDLRSFYKDADYPLTKKSMLGAVGITGIVVSDHSGKNLPAGLLMVQNKVRLNALRGIAINIGAAAAQFVPGDSVIVHLEGGTLTRIDGILQITGLDASAVTRVAQGIDIPVNRVPGSFILADPDKYESTELVIVKGGFDPLPLPTDTYSGDRVVNDGFASFTLHTEPTATFANNTLPGMANFFGVIAYSKDDNGNYVPHLRIRRPEDITILSATITQAAIVISGYIGDVAGTDLDGEYMQFLATEDIDFSVTPYSVVTHNTSSGYSPTGVPVNGWKTGGKRDYKFDLISGTVQKGQYFYVGNSAKLINGVGSTSIEQGKWIVSRKTGSVPGDGIGNASTDLFLNGTSAYTDGIAVFKGTLVDENSIPIDVIITGYNGAILNIGQGAGLRITNTDWYDIVNPVNLEVQPFYKQGSNTLYITRKGAGYFYKLGGQYNTRLGRWVQARFNRALLLSTTSTLDELEKEYPAADGTTEAWVPTKVVD